MTDEQPDYWDEQGAAWRALEGKTIASADAMHEHWHNVVLRFTDGSEFFVDADGDVMIESGGRSVRS